jgi:8-oxo-dGTP pyrophosphatase MutT (NUDIX family)
MLTQYGAIPHRREAGETRILLVTSRETKRWVIPRGNPIRGLSPAQAAAQEAFEEAGVTGAMVAEPIGRYNYGKRRRDGSVVPAEVEVYALEVEVEREEWPERHQRERRWFAPEEAAAAVDEPGLAALLRSLAH